VYHVRAGGFNLALRPARGGGRSAFSLRRAKDPICNETEAPRAAQPREFGQYPESLGRSQPGSGTARVAIAGAVAARSGPELDREVDGRWIAEVRELNVFLYGDSRQDAIQRAQSAAQEIVLDRIADGELPADSANAPFDVAR